MLRRLSKINVITAFGEGTLSHELGAESAKIVADMHMTMKCPKYPPSDHCEPEGYECSHLHNINDDMEDDDTEYACTQYGRLCLFVAKKCQRYNGGADPKHFEDDPLAMGLFQQEIDKGNAGVSPCTVECSKDCNREMGYTTVPLRLEDKYRATGYGDPIPASNIRGYIIIGGENHEVLSEDMVG